MIRLLFIVPYPELEEVVRSVLSNHPQRERLNVEIQVMTVEDTPDVPTEEYDAIIARGYTAQKTSSRYQQIPTIELSISSYDLIQAISECCEQFHPKKIAVCSFGQQLYEVQNICRLFHTGTFQIRAGFFKLCHRTVSFFSLEYVRSSRSAAASRTY